MREKNQAARGRTRKSGQKYENTRDESKNEAKKTREKKEAKKMGWGGMRQTKWGGGE